MVNKQYNIETLKRDKNIIHSKKMLDSSECSVQQSSKLDNGKDLKELSLSDIGRFQYILQMDKEMVSKIFGGKKNYIKNFNSIEVDISLLFNLFIELKL